MAMYNENDTVRVAKRENNNKRNYLVVNMFQGKHVPVSPKHALDMFYSLADSVKGNYENERVLVIGFAETATAIGAALAVRLNAKYIQTTRENIDGAEYLYFTEAHSHASEQKLVKNDLDFIIDKTDRIIFAEDEVTTGNTILNIIGAIEKNYGKKLLFSVASVLNGMDDGSVKIYNDRNIALHWLIKTNHGGYAEAAEKYKLQGIYNNKNKKKPKMNIKVYEMRGYTDARRLVDGRKYFEHCEILWHQIKEEFYFGFKNVLVLGSEEFMFPALYAAGKIEETGCNVMFHSTTRSPIEVYAEEEYPLHERFELAGLYDDERKTFIYNLKKYDAVLIITDAPGGLHKGIYSLVNALMLKGNSDIFLFRWR